MSSSLPECQHFLRDGIRARRFRRFRFRILAGSALLSFESSTVESLELLVHLIELQKVTLSFSLELVDPRDKRLERVLEASEPFSCKNHATNMARFLCIDNPRQTPKLGRGPAQNYGGAVFRPAYWVFKQRQYGGFRSRSTLPRALRSWESFARQFGLPIHRPHAQIEESLIPHYPSPQWPKDPFIYRSELNPPNSTVLPKIAKLLQARGYHD